MSKAVDLAGEEPILDRTGVAHSIRRDLNEPVSYLETLTDYGVQLLKRSLASSSRETPDVVLLPVLFRQVLAFADSVHLHLAAGAVHSAVPSVRALFEATLSMEWIVTQGKERWGRQFYVSELRQRRNWAAMLVPDTPENAKLSAL